MGFPDSSPSSFHRGFPDIVINSFQMFPRGLKAIFLALSLLGHLTNVAASPSGFDRRQLPAPVTGLKTITSPSGVTIRYKEPGKEGICETTPGVNSYTGYIDLAPDSHTFFWFFEARHNPEEAPLTLWLNGGPGSDSLIGLFQGKCYRFMSRFSSRLPLNSSCNTTFQSSDLATSPKTSRPS